MTKRSLLLSAILSATIGLGLGQLRAEITRIGGGGSSGGAVTVTDSIRFAASPLSFLISPYDRTDTQNGKPLVIEGQKADDNQLGGRVTVRGGQGGDGSGQGGDLKLEGGAPGTTGAGGDVIIGCHPDATSACGVDVCHDANCLEILFGHAPVNDSDQTGKVSFEGRIKTTVYFDKDVAGNITADPPASIGGTGISVGITGADTKAADSSTAAGKGGTGRVSGGAGGAGSASRAAGAGGDANIYAGAAGANNGGGGATGGTVDMRVGAGTNGTHGAINLGASGSAPSQINVGQAATAVTVLGTITAARLPGTFEGTVSTASGTITWPLTPIARTILLKTTGGDRAVIFPPVATSGLCPTGGVREFVVATDGTVSGHTIYLYAPNDGSKLNGQTYPTAGGTITSNYKGVRVYTDCANFFSPDLAGNPP